MRKVQEGRFRSEASSDLCDGEDGVMVDLDQLEEDEGDEVDKEVGSFLLSLV